MKWKPAAGREHWCRRDRWPNERSSHSRYRREWAAVRRLDALQWCERQLETDRLEPANQTMKHELTNFVWTRICTNSTLAAAITSSTVPSNLHRGLINAWTNQKQWFTYIISIASNRDAHGASTWCPASATDIARAWTANPLNDKAPQTPNVGDEPIHQNNQTTWRLMSSCETFPVKTIHF